MFLCVFLKNTRFITNKNLLSITGKDDFTFDVGIDHKKIDADKIGIVAQELAIDVKKVELLHKNSQNSAFMSLKEKEKEKEKHPSLREVCVTRESGADFSEKSVLKKTLPSALKLEIEKVLSGENLTLKSKPTLKSEVKANPKPETMDANFLLWNKKYGYNPYSDSLKNSFK